MSESSQPAMAGVEKAETNVAHLSVVRSTWPQEPKLSRGPAVKGRSWIIVGNRTGGQGKTLTAEFILSVLPEAISQSADSVAAVVGGDEGQSKLGRLFPGTAEIGTGPSAEDVNRDPSLYDAFWDPHGEAIASDPKGAPVVTDFGANVIDSLFAWAKRSYVGEAFSDPHSRVAVEMVIPYVASPQAIGDALSVARSLMQGDLFPLRRLILVENEIQGSFDKFKDYPQLLELREMAKAIGSKRVVLERNGSNLLRALEMNNLRKDWASSASKDKVAKSFGMNFFQAARELSDVQEWVAKTQYAFREALGLVAEAGPKEFERR